jgi:hypothetical protein
MKSDGPVNKEEWYARSLPTSRDDEKRGGDDET